MSEIDPDLAWIADADVELFLSDFCGCCGDGPIAEDDDWCWRCVDHVLDDGPLWERTWQAQHGEPCLFAV